MMFSKRHAACIALFVSILGHARSAGANGKFPAADQLVIDPGDPTHLVLRTTFGILTSRNSGQDWDWICETAVGYEDYEPGLAVTGDGSIIVGLYDGVSVAADDSCGWSISLPGVVPDVSVSRSDPSVAVAITTEETVTRYWESADNGVSFAQVGVNLPADFVGVTVDVAPSDPSRIYASGVRVDDSGGGEGMLARSIDHGASWTIASVPGSDADKVPYIGAVDPSDPDRLYVRLDNAASLLVSSDGGDSWTAHDVGAMMLPLIGLALSPDGTVIVVGNEFEGVWRAPTSSLAFEQLSTLAVRCLTWTDAGIYACVNEFLYCDGFIAGLSRDEGSSFTPLLQLNGVRGPLTCSPGSSVDLQCPSLWPAVSDQLDKELCGGTGVGGAGGNGGSASGGDAPKSNGGCSCTTPRGSPTTSTWWSLLLGTLVVGRTRHRKFGVRVRRTS